MWGSDIVDRRQFYQIPVSFCLVVCIFAGAMAGNEIIPVLGTQPDPGSQMAMGFVDIFPTFLRKTFSGSTGLILWPCQPPGREFLLRIWEPR